MALRNNGIKDAGVPLVVDPFTRKVTVPATERVIGVVGDHCSEQVTFQIPRMIDNHDMASSTRRYVAWRNVDGEPGTDELAITESTKDHILLGWTIRDRLALSKGLVDFSLHFECWGKDEHGVEKLIYKWGTHTCSACEILDAVNAKLGAYAAIYIDGETLVFADYTPVADEKIDLTSCVVPKDTLEITEAGTHDVGSYAYAEVKGVYDTPDIIVEAGIVTAEANGLTAHKELETPVIAIVDGKVTATANGLTATDTVHPTDFCAMTPVRVIFKGWTGTLVRDTLRESGKLEKEVIRALTGAAPVEFSALVGTSLWFSIREDAPTVEAKGVNVADGTRTTSGGVVYAVVNVPAVEDSAVFEITVKV